MLPCPFPLAKSSRNDHQDNDTPLKWMKSFLAERKDSTHLVKGQEYGLLRTSLQHSLHIGSAGLQGLSMALVCVILLCPD